MTYNHFRGLNYCHSCKRILDEDNVTRKTEKQGEGWITFLYCGYCGDGNISEFDAVMFLDVLDQIRQAMTLTQYHDFKAHRDNLEVADRILQAVFDL